MLAIGKLTGLCVVAGWVSSGRRGSSVVRFKMDF